MPRSVLFDRNKIRRLESKFLMFNSTVQNTNLESLGWSQTFPSKDERLQQETSGINDGAAEAARKTNQDSLCLVVTVWL